MSKIITIDKLKTALQSVADLLNSHSDHISSLSAQVDNKVTKIAGMGLSEANYTKDDEQKMVYTNIAYGTCSDSAGTAAKRITIKDNSKWILRTGSIITVMFSYTNTASNPTFNVNNTGAKNVYYQSSRITTSNLNYAGYANRPMTFMYDGTQYRFIGWGYDNNSDTKVTQTITTTNAEYPLLLAPNGQAATTTTTSYFNSGVTLNPSTNTIAANVSGNAASATQAAQLSTIQAVSSSANKVDKYALLTTYTIDATWSGYHGTISVVDNESSVSGIVSVKARTGSDKGKLNAPRITWLSLTHGELSDALVLTEETDATTGNCIVRLYWRPGAANVTPYFATIYEKGDNYVTSRQSLVSSYTDTYLGTIVATSGVSSALYSSNAKQSDKLSTARTIALSGGATGTATSFDGSKDISIPITNIDPAYIGEGVTSKRWYLNSSQEGNGVVIPFICNDLAFMNKRGGSVKVFVDDVETEDSNIYKLFDGTTNYWSKTITGINKVTFEATLPSALAHGQTIYVDFFAANYRAKSIKLEIMNSNYADDVWAVKDEVTDYSKSAYYKLVAHTPVGGTSQQNGFNKIRLTFSDFQNSTLFRIAELGVVSYNGGAATSVCLPRGGGDMYGNITPYTAETLSVGSEDKKFNHMYANYFHGLLIGGLRSVDTSAKSSYTQNLIYLRGSLPQGTATDRTYCSPFGKYTDSNNTPIDYGSLIRLSYESKYYTDIWADANIKSGLVYHQVVNGTSQGWKTLLDSSNFRTHLTGHYLTVDLTDAEQGTANLINADSLGGILASQYALKSDLNNTGVISVAQGGTGATDAATARTNLGITAAWVQSCLSNANGVSF